MTRPYLALFIIGIMSSIAGAPARTSEAAFANAAAASRSGDSESIANDSDDINAELPLLPASDPDSDIPSIKLGDTIRFEEMGPIIINLAGTTRRIENWNEMTKQEQEVSWRRIAKRNEERRKMLMEKMKKEADQGIEEDPNSN